MNWEINIPRSSERFVVTQIALYRIGQRLSTSGLAIPVEVWFPLGSGEV